MFYVALTRGRHETLLMAQTRSVSEFLDEIEPDAMPRAELSGLPVPRPLIGMHEALIVSDGYDIRHQLAKMGFKLDRRCRAWWKVASDAELTQVQRALSRAAPEQAVVRQSAELPIAPPSTG